MSNGNERVENVIALGLSSPRRASREKYYLTAFRRFLNYHPTWRFLWLSSHKVTLDKVTLDKVTLKSLRSFVFIVAGAPVF